MQASVKSIRKARTTTESENLEAEITVNNLKGMSIINQSNNMT